MSISYDHLTEEERAEARRFMTDFYLWVLSRPAKTPTPAPAVPEPKRKSPRKRSTQTTPTAQPAAPFDPDTLPPHLRAGLG